MKNFDSLKWNLLNWIIQFLFPHINHISTEELALLLSDKEERHPLILDARNKIEYAISHLKEASLIPYDSPDIKSLVQCSLNTPIITYCSVGYRSAILAQRLQKMGYKKVFNLQGSLFLWFSENRPIVCGEEIVSYIHPFNLFWSLWL